MAWVNAMPCEAKGPGADLLGHDGNADSAYARAVGLRRSGHERHPPSSRRGCGRFDASRSRAAIATSRMGQFAMPGPGPAGYASSARWCPRKRAPEQLEDVPGLDIDENGRARSGRNACTMSRRRRSILRRVSSPGARVEVLHGKMAAQGARTMSSTDFGTGRYRCCSSATTVVEVGVDVPNATVMLIENGERFGLATLASAARSRGPRVDTRHLLCARPRLAQSAASESPALRAPRGAGKDR
ncbi:MAG: helicase-related protein [Collinsella sp.]